MIKKVEPNPIIKVTIAKYVFSCHLTFIFFATDLKDFHRFFNNLIFDLFAGDKYISSGKPNSLICFFHPSSSFFSGASSSQPLFASSSSVTFTLTDVFLLICYY